MSIAARYVDAFLSSMNATGKTFLNRTVGPIRKLDQDQGKLYPSPRNSQVISELSKAMDDTVNSPAFKTKLRWLPSNVDDIQFDLLKKYEKQFDYSEWMLEQIDALAAKLKNNLTVILSDPNLGSNIINPYINRLYGNVGGRHSINAAVNEYVPVENEFSAYFITNVTSQLESFEREVIDMLSGENGVETFEYSGPKDDLNRSFCASKVGGVYTRDQIKAFVNEAPWAGMFPNTNGVNIFVNLGGYNCRHILEPTKGKKPKLPDLPKITTVPRSMVDKPNFKYTEKEALAIIKEDLPGVLREYGNLEKPGDYMKAYTSDLYDRINASGNPDDPFPEPAMRALLENTSRAIEKLPKIKYETIYRVEKIGSERGRQRLHEYINAPRGHEFTRQGIYSGSHATDSTFFPRDFNDDAVYLSDMRRGRFLRIEITTKTGGSQGADITRFSELKAEKEVVWKMATDFIKDRYDPVRHILYLIEK